MHRCHAARQPTTGNQPWIVHRILSKPEYEAGRRGPKPWFFFYASDACDELTDQERGGTSSVPGRIPTIDKFFRAWHLNNAREMFFSMPFDRPYILKHTFLLCIIRGNSRPNIRRYRAAQKSFVNLLASHNVHAEKNSRRSCRLTVIILNFTTFIHEWNFSLRRHYARDDLLMQTFYFSEILFYLDSLLTYLLN